MGIRSLLVSDIVPRHPPSGAVQRLALVAGELAALGPLDAVFVPVTADDVPSGPGAPGGGPFTRHHVIALPPATSFRGVAEWALHGGSAAYVHHRREGVRDRLPGWATGTRYDVVWYNRERMWLPFRGMLSGPAVVDVDDIEDVLVRQWLRRGRGPHGGPLTPWQFLQARRSIAWWRSMHRLTVREAAVVVHSTDPQDPVWRRPRTIVIPNTYPPPDGDAGEGGTGGPGVRPDAQDGPDAPGDRAAPTILLPGAFHWPPNADAARWLVEEIAPRIRRSVPDLTVVLAGEPSPQVRRLDDGPRVRVVGAVADMTPYLRAADLVVVPLRVGSGTRIKILEAFAHGVPVVSTTIGASGLDVVPGVHLAVADSAAGLAHQCVALLRDPAARARLATAGRGLQAERYLPRHAQDQLRLAVRLALAAPENVPARA